MTTERVDPRVRRTRTAVLRATLELAGERGFGGLTLEHIAARAEVAPSTIYRHWSGLDEVILDAVEIEVQVDIDVPNTGSVRDDLVLIMLEWGRIVRGERYGVIAPHLISAAALHPRIREVVMRTGLEREAFELQVLDRGVKRGELPQHLDTRAALELFIAPAYWHGFVAFEPVTDEWIVDHVDRVLQLIRAWPAPRTPNRAPDTRRQPGEQDPLRPPAGALDG